MPKGWLFVVIIALSGFSHIGRAEPITESELTTIYLIRHAEKQATKPNPALNQCGHLRAQSLAKQFELIKINQLYSSDYRRTISTATPLANQQNLTIKLYDPRKLGSIADQLLSLEGTTVVIGHSNTTSVLAGMLVGIELPSFDESIYDRIYQVTIFEGKAKLQILKQHFSCPMTI